MSIILNLAMLLFLHCVFIFLRHLPPVLYNRDLEYRPQPYVRRPIDYKALDHVGLGGTKDISPEQTDNSSPASGRSVTLSKIGGTKKYATLRSSRSNGSSLSLSGMMKMPSLPSVPIVESTSEELEQVGKKVPLTPYLNG